MSPDPSLVERLSRHGQGHLLKWWGVLGNDERSRLAGEIEGIDFDQLDALIADLVREEKPAVPDAERVEPIEVHRLPQTDGERVARRHVAECGAAVLAAGEVGVVLVAGGSGTRLGFDGPKGTYPIGPVSAASLFQIHAEKIVALGRRYGQPLPLYVMTSPENHEATIRSFADNGNFGLDHVRLFVQGQMPAVDRETGKVLLAQEGHVALSPDGHGGTLTALAAPGPGGSPSCLDEMRERGVRTLFYFQVDNPLVKIADPAFIGLHRQADAEVSFKVIEKLVPDEKVGVVVRVDGRAQVIEYSDLPPELAERRSPEGNLELWAGSIAVHIFERAFIERIVGQLQLPFHRAIKKVPYVDRVGRPGPADRPERHEVRAVHLRCPAAGRALDDGRDRPRRRVRTAQERRGPRLARDGPPADERPVRRLARTRRGDRAPTIERHGPVRHRDQPAVCPR